MLQPFSGDKPFRSKDAKQMQMATLLVTLGSKEDACNQMGIALSTLNRWFKEPAFREMLEAARSEAFQVVSDDLTRVGSKAVRELERLIETPGVADGVKARAADSLLARLVQYREIGIAEGRLAQIEETISHLTGEA